MGLDGVELVMSIEEEFGITIPDSDAQAMRTVGDLVEICFVRINAAKKLQCVSLPCFLAIRRLAREVCGDDELKIRPSTFVQDCLDKTERRLFWKRLPEILQSHPKPLRRPALLRAFLVFVVLAFPVIMISAIQWPLDKLLLIGITAFALPIILHLATKMFRTIPPYGYRTFGDVTKRMVGLQIATKPPVQTDYDSVFAIVRTIIVERLGFEEEEITPDARFIEDLGF